MSSTEFFSDESIEARIRKAEEALDVLKHLTKMTYDEFASNLINVYAAKGALLIIAQAIIDMANYLIASKDFGVPASREEVMDILESYGVFPENIAKKLIELVRIRDRLLHSYSVIGEKALYEEISSIIEIIEKALSIIQREIRSLSTQ